MAKDEADKKRCKSCGYIWVENEVVLVCPNCSSNDIIENYLEPTGEPGDPSIYVNRTDWSLLKDVVGHVYVEIVFLILAVSVLGLYILWRK